MPSELGPMINQQSMRVWPAHSGIGLSSGARSQKSALYSPQNKRFLEIIVKSMKRSSTFSVFALALGLPYDIFQKMSGVKGVRIDPA